MIEKKCKYPAVVQEVNKKTNRNDKRVIVSRNTCRFCKHFKPREELFDELRYN